MQTYIDTIAAADALGSDTSSGSNVLQILTDTQTVLDLSFADLASSTMRQTYVDFMNALMF